MRKCKVQRILPLCLILVMCLTANMLGGCGIHVGGLRMEWPESEKQTPQAISIVAGIHEYTPAVSFDTEAIKKQIYEACYTYGNVSLVVADGEPFVAYNFEIKKPDKNIDDSKRRQLAKGNAQQILTEFPKACAKTEEYDPLTAISLSADTLQSSQDGTEHTMIICDSGLSTTSYLNFLESNLFETPVETIVSKLEELHAIPELESVDIIWIGLSKTCGAQPSLDSDHKYKLQELWEAILTAGGAKSVTFDKSPVSREGYSGNLPPCSTVPIESNNPDFASSTVQQTIPEVIKWDGNSNVRFQGDSAALVDEDAAERELAPIGEYLKSNPQKSVYIFGMTASIFGGDSNIPLAEARARACQQLLVSKGVPESQMSCVGLGQLPNQQRVDDLDENGMQIEELAQKNRAVIIVDSESPLVAILLKSLENLE